MRRLSALVMVFFGCGDANEARTEFEAEFPARMCAWVADQCPPGNDPDIGDCVTYYTERIALERTHNPCFSPYNAKMCLRQLDPADAAFEACDTPPAWHIRPQSCWYTSWVEPDGECAPPEALANFTW